MNDLEILLMLTLPVIGIILWDFEAFFKAILADCYGPQRLPLCTKKRPKSAMKKFR